MKQLFKHIAAGFGVENWELDGLAKLNFMGGGAVSIENYFMIPNLKNLAACYLFGSSFRNAIFWVLNGLEIFQLS